MPNYDFSLHVVFVHDVALEGIVKNEGNTSSDFSKLNKKTYTGFLRGNALYWEKTSINELIHLLSKWGYSVDDFIKAFKKNLSSS